MPRYPGQSSLPPLETTLPGFQRLEPDRPKVGQVSDSLREVVMAYRTAHNLIFYASRDIARFFHVSQNTAALAVERLEQEGLLRRIRGSQTLMLGCRIITRTRIRAVAVLMSWVFAQRFSSFQINLNRTLAQALWPRQIALNIVPYYDLNAGEPDIDAVLRQHRIDFAIWPFPFPHHKEPMLALGDRGVRNLVIGVEGASLPFQPDILIDLRTPYGQLLQYWREEHGIRRVVIVSPREFAPRQQIALFAKMAREAGFDARLEPSTERLPGEILSREKEKVGIVLLDEHAAVEFTFYDPPAFTRLLERHRILYGQAGLHVPFVVGGKYRVERIFIPLRWGHSIEEMPVVPAITERLAQWSYGDFSAGPHRLPAILWRRGELWRYL